MAKMYIMVGLPGSGKSTKAKTLNGVVISTDQIFMSDDIYLFSPSILSMAHQINQEKVRVACSLGHDVIIDNTNLSARERAPYIDIANSFGYSWEIIQPDTWWRSDPEECFRRNKHGVPLQAIQRMAERKDIT